MNIQNFTSNEMEEGLPGNSVYLSGMGISKHFLPKDGWTDSLQQE